MMLKITKSFMDYLTATLTPLLMKPETINANNANVTANVDSCKNNNQSIIGTSRKSRAKLSGGRPMSLFRVSHKDLILMTWRFLSFEFCERNLTIKSRMVRTRRLGRDKGPACKLCVTLENKISVDSVLSSSRMLRSSPDSELRRCFSIVT